MENTPYKVVYIDDQPEMLELVRLALRRIGCEVYGVTDGVQGLELMRRLQPDLVLLDLMLPGYDGWQVKGAMEADPLLRALPLVLVTARVPSAAAVAERQPPPAEAYVTKPFALTEFRSTIQDVLARRAA
jgi:CheY-like chemotaxis protein